MLSQLNMSKRTGTNKVLSTPVKDKMEDITFVPVSAIIQKFKDTSQTTLTQLFGEIQKDSSSDDDDFIIKRKTKKERKEPALVTPVAVKKRRKSHDTGRVKKSTGSLAQRGDLVTSTAAELKHPRLLFGDIDEGYIFFGIVTKSDETTVNVKWSTVEIGHQKAKVGKKKDKKIQNISGGSVAQVEDLFGL